MLLDTTDPAVDVNNTPVGSRAPAVDHGNARSVVEAYVAWVLAGEVANAAALARNAPADPKRIAELPEFSQCPAIECPDSLCERSHATNASLDDFRKPLSSSRSGQRDGFMVFTLELTDDQWLVIDIDFESESGAEKKLKRFLEANPGSIGLPPQPRGGAKFGQLKSRTSARK